MAIEFLKLCVPLMAGRSTTYHIENDIVLESETEVSRYLIFLLTPMAESAAYKVLTKTKAAPSSKRKVSATEPKSKKKPKPSADHKPALKVLAGTGKYVQCLNPDTAPAVQIDDIDPEVVVAENEADGSSERPIMFIDDVASIIEATISGFMKHNITRPLFVFLCKGNLTIKGQTIRKYSGLRNLMCQQVMTGKEFEDITGASSSSGTAALDEAEEALKRLAPPVNITTTPRIQELIATTIDGSPLLESIARFRSSFMNSPAPIQFRPESQAIVSNIWMTLGPLMHGLNSIEYVLQVVLPVISTHIPITETMAELAGEILMFIKEHSEFPEGVDEVFSDIIMLHEFLTVRVDLTTQLVKVSDISKNIH